MRRSCLKKMSPNARTGQPRNGATSGRIESRRARPDLYPSRVSAIASSTDCGDGDYTEQIPQIQISRPATPANRSRSISSSMARAPRPFPVRTAHLASSALLLTSCFGDVADDPAGESPTDEVTQVSEVRVDTVRVTLDEYSIRMPGTLPAGRTVLRLESRGFEEHNLFFVRNDSDSVVWETARRLSPYETRTVTVDLVPGDYTVVCDFSGHQGRGMFMDLTVEPVSPPQ